MSEIIISNNESAVDIEPLLKHLSKSKFNLEQRSQHLYELHQCIMDSESEDLIKQASSGLQTISSLAKLLSEMHTVK